MSDNIEKIYNSAMYAREKGIDPTNPDTWDNNYRNRQMELAGLLPKIEEEIKNIKEGIKKACFNS
jgi:hypothetical protein